MGIKALHAIEGNRQRLDGGSLFGNAPKAMWAKWHKPDALNRISMATRALLVQTDDDRNYLFEVGVGAFFEPKLRERYGVEPSEHVLLQNLEAVGVNETDIDGGLTPKSSGDQAAWEGKQDERGGEQRGEDGGLSRS